MNNSELITYISIAVIAISLFSIGTQMTGHVTTNDTGIVNVTIETKTAINFTTDFTDFGVGSVSPGKSGSTLYTNGTVVDGNWGGTSTYLVIENIGNTDVSLGLHANKDAGTFLGGSNPQFQYLITNTTGRPGCAGARNGTAYTDFATSEEAICDSFAAANDQDSVDVNIKLYIPSDSNVGNLTATITATGTYTEAGSGPSTDYFILTEGHVGAVYGYSSGIMGYIEPEYYKGYHIYELRWNDEGILIFNLEGEVDQDFFNSVTPCLSCDTYDSGDAYYYYSGSSMTSWYWYAPSQPWDGVGTSTVAFE